MVENHNKASAGKGTDSGDGFLRGSLLHAGDGDDPFKNDRAGAGANDKLHPGDHQKVALGSDIHHQGFPSVQFTDSSANGQAHEHGQRGRLLNHLMRMTNSESGSVDRTHAQSGHTASLESQRGHTGAGQEAHGLMSNLLETANNRDVQVSPSDGSWQQPQSSDHADHTLKNLINNSRDLAGGVADLENSVGYHGNGFRHLQQLDLRTHGYAHESGIPQMSSHMNYEHHAATGQFTNYYSNERTYGHNNVQYHYENQSGDHNSYAVQGYRHGLPPGGFQQHAGHGAPQRPLPPGGFPKYPSGSLPPGGFPKYPHR